MRMKKSALLASFALVAAASSGIADAQNVRILGRFVRNDAQSFTIAWPASGFEARLDGEKLTATIDDGGTANWLNVEVDGQVGALHLEKGVNTYTLFDGEPGIHTIRVTRRTAATSGRTKFISLDAKGQLTPTPMPDRRILVIGNSADSGFGVEGQDRTCKYTPVTQNADLAYSALAARDLGADLELIAMDGKGLVKDYAGEGAHMDEIAWRVMPDSPQLWPNEAFEPQAIVVNLGTNDFAHGDPGKAFTDAYSAMIQRLHAHWPDAEVFVVTGAMPDAANYPAMSAAVRASVQNRIDAGDTKIQFIEFKLPAAGRRYGCDWRPGIDAQKAMAATLEAAIRTRIGWTVSAGSAGEALR